jgi:ankyrin repeat protein
MAKVRVTKKLGVGAAISLLTLIGIVASYIALECGVSINGETNRNYEVRYVWDNGIKSLQIINRKTGAEETDPKFRNLVSAEAERYLPGLVSLAGLVRARGRFLVGLLGNEEPYLLQEAAGTEDPDLVKDPDVTSLMSALDRGDREKARALIAAGADVNASDQHGQTALMRAASLGDAATVQALLAAGAQLNAQNRDGETALFPAAFLDRTAVVRKLIQHGADVNVTSRKQVTPLMEAASHSPRIVDLLISRGANVNARDVLGGTALMMAARGGRGDIVRVLIKAGADVNAKDNEGRTALSGAVDAGHGQVARLLEQSGAHRGAHL